MEQGLNIALDNLANSNPIIFLLVSAICTLYYVQMRMIRQYHKDKNYEINKLGSIIENNTSALKEVLRFIESNKDNQHKESMNKMDLILSKINSKK